MKRLNFAGLAVALVLPLAGAAVAQEHGHDNAAVPDRLDWSFAGPLGKFDQAQLQRGFRVYKEVCSACHQLAIPFRQLSEAGGPGFTDAQVKALAAEYKVKDGPNDAGEMFERPGRPSDDIPWNFANNNAARAALGGALPPPMRLLAKARSISRGFPMFLLDALPFTAYQEKGPDYIAALLQHYSDPPPGVTMEPGQYYNSIMPGGKIAMPPPLSDDAVPYEDGSPKTVQQYATDISAFLMWAAEPKLEERKRTGFRVMTFLIVFAGLLWFVKKRIWAGLHENTNPLPDAGDAAFAAGGRSTYIAGKSGTWS